MSALREFTEAEIEWVKENYSRMSQKDCATYLHCTNNTVRTLAKKLGIYVNKHPLKVEDKSKEIVPLEEVEMAHIHRVVEKCHGNISKAAEMLGITRQTLYAKIKR